MLPVLLGTSHSGHQWVSKCGPQPAASASLGNLLEMQILSPYPNPSESDFGMRPTIGALTSPPGIQTPTQI